MKILLVYPECPDSFWGFRHALKFISRKAAQPPLGLVTIAAMLPESWKKRVLDEADRKLEDKDIEWADMVFISAMSIQKNSARAIIQRCVNAGVTTVAGGPLFTASYEDFDDVDHLVLNEAEITLPLFLKDLENGSPKRIYKTNEFADLSDTPTPLWHLLDIKKYAQMDIQYSRGCPFDCEFCDISVLFGRDVRTKSKTQMIAELESLYSHGWRGNILIVDDNFIGNKKKLKKEILPAITEWMDEKGHPFSFHTEASINLADDIELIRMMSRAGFTMVFIGIESPNEESLAECNKIQNRNRDLIADVKKIQENGLQVTAGFILGFDNDSPTIFERMAAFIQESSIVNAMVGLLNALPNTKLYKRLMNEGRLLNQSTGNNTDFTTNFMPKMDIETLVEGYKSVINKIYAPKPYYQRVTKFLKEYKPGKYSKFHFHSWHLEAFVKSIMTLGILEKGRRYFWKLFFWTLITRPKMMPMALTFAIYGYHYRKYFGGLM